MKPAARRIAAYVALLLLATAAHPDEIYKWVDKDGTTHYSSRKDDAGGAATATLRSEPARPPVANPAAATAPASRAANEDIIRRPAAGGYEPKSLEPPVTPKPADPNYASEAGSTKCRLARDILAGRARHRSGEPVDAYDRQTAEADVRAFCPR